MPGPVTKAPPASRPTKPMSKPVSKPTPYQPTKTRSVKSSVNGVNGAAAKSNRAAAALSSPPPPSQHHSPYEIMASRIANRVAEIAENITFVEREKPPASPAPAAPSVTKRPPRKLEIRLAGSAAAQENKSVSFSAPFLDNTLAKMLVLQNRMLKVSQDLAATGEDGRVGEDVRQEQYAQSAELSRIIALICAEKARQGA